GFSSLLPATADAPWRQRAEAGRAGQLDSTLLLRAAEGGGGKLAPGEFLDEVQRELSAAGFAPTDRATEEAQRWRALAAALHPHRWRLLAPEDYRALSEQPE